MRSWVTSFPLTTISNNKDKHKKLIQTEEKHQKVYNED